jgi:DNA-binding NarL/FixJ family response regulator
MLRLAIIDDHSVFREALAALLAQQSDLVVAAQGATIADVPRIAGASPDVVLVDTALGQASGFDATVALRRISRVKVLFVSAVRGEEWIARALSSGANGYVYKEQPAAALLEAIRAVARGQSYLPPDVSRFAVDEHLGRLREHPATERAATTRVTDDVVVRGPLDPLTPREREVFRRLARGEENLGMARALGISVKTVETHRARILKKLGLHSLAELVRFAARHSLLD